MTGGSNYISFAMAIARPIIGCYHLDADLCESHMQAMYDNGQRKIAFFIWFTQVPANAPIKDVWLMAINSRGGKLSGQHCQNLSDVINLAHEIGFQEIIVRIGPIGVSGMLGKAWNQAVFDENLSFVMDVVATAESTGYVNGYDLGVEGIRPDETSAKQYITGVWEAFTDKYGPAKGALGIGSGSSPKLTARRATALFSWLKDAGLPLPGRYSIDCYSRQYEVLKALHDVMVKNGVGKKPVILQECFYNEALTAQEIKKAKAIPGLKLRSIYQWPLERGSGQKDQSVIYTPLFDKYQGLIESQSQRRDTMRESLLDKGIDCDKVVHSDQPNESPTIGP